VGFFTLGFSPRKLCVSCLYAFDSCDACDACHIMIVMH
jgi:hypothetical protein